MQLHEVKRENLRAYARTRVGRGGKRGTTSGRGTKGQKSRAGHRIRPAERDYIQRLPKLRGSTGRKASEKPLVISLSRLAAITSLKEVNPETLIRAGIIRAREADHVKILGTEKLIRPLIVKGIAVSKSARTAIEAAGGSIAK